jgi:hypothetical protein
MSATGVERRYVSNSGHWQKSVGISYHRRRQIMARTNRRFTLALGLGAAWLLVLRTPQAEAAVGEEKELTKGVCANGEIVSNAS